MWKCTFKLRAEPKRWIEVTAPLFPSERPVGGGATSSSIEATAGVVTLPILAILLLVQAAPGAETPAVAIVRFENNTGDPAWDPLGRGLADMLVTDLGGVGGGLQWLNGSGWRRFSPS